MDKKIELSSYEKQMIMACKQGSMRLSKVKKVIADMVMMDEEYIDLYTIQYWLQKLIIKLSNTGYYNHLSFERLLNDMWEYPYTNDSFGFECLPREQYIHFLISRIQLIEIIKDGVDILEMGDLIEYNTEN